MGFFGGGGAADLASPSAIGSTTPNTGAFTTLSANNGTLTSSSPAFTLAQTWNSAGVVFTALRANVTDTASNASSLLMDLQVGGATRASIGKNGRLVLWGSSSDAAWIESTAQFRTASLGIGFGTGAGNGVVIASATSSLVYAGMGPSGVFTTGYFGFATSAAAASDVTLFRDAANILAQRNSTNAQAFRLYNTFTDASNYERGFFRWNTNVLEIGAEAAGTGTQRTISFLGGSNNSAISFTSNSLNAVFGNNANIFYKNIQSEASIRFSGLDLGISRNAAGVMELNNGTAGTFRDLIVRNLRMSAPTLVPASASATGSEGQISWDASYIYVCTATNTWKRVAIATW